MEKEYVTVGGGAQQEFDSGARRDGRSGKGRFDLLPVRALTRLAGLLERGAEKYGDDNWRHGIPIKRYLDSGLRHAFQALEKETMDDYIDTQEDHLIAAAWNFLCAAETLDDIEAGFLSGDLDDRFIHTFDRSWAGE